MEILGTDIILIDHNGVLAKFEAKDLSSYYGTKDNIEEVSKELDAMLETIIDLSVSFGSTHYTKSEIKENYATKIQCTTVLENTNYSSDEEIDAEMAKYTKKDNIDGKKSDMMDNIKEHRGEEGGSGGDEHVWKFMADTLVHMVYPEKE